MSNVLVGTAIGDALGVPFETMRGDNPLLVNWDGKSYLGSKHHGLLPAQYSDDTQMSLMVAESLIENNGFVPEDLCARYVDWIVSGRARGYGRTTFMAVEKLQKGIHWSESGVPGSYGNGTAMRAAPFGIYFRHDIAKLVESVKIDSAITHQSHDAEAGALAIALATAYIANHDTDNLIDKIMVHLPDSCVKHKLSKLHVLISAGASTTMSLALLGTGANVRETVPAAIYCVLRFDNYYDAVLAAIKAGGDTDTTAAIVGALFGAKSSLKDIDKSFFEVEDFDKLVTLDSKLYNKSSAVFFPRN
jgi:ADP-ribosylglycohydrolase